MLARVFTMRFNSMMDGFDDGPLQSFIKDKEVLTIRDHFFVKDDVPYIALIVTFNLHPLAQPPQKTTAGGQRERDESWRELVTEADVPLFNALRDWRSERCKKEGVPPYVICTNRQLAAIVKARPQTSAGLLTVEGLGQAKLEKYGKDLLALLSQPQAVPGETEPGTPVAGAQDDQPAK